MVFKKKFECSSNGYQVPAMPQIPISAKGKRSVRRKVVDNQMCAFDLLIAVARKILERDNSSTVNSIVGNSNQNVKQEQLDEEKFCKDEAFYQVSCNESTSTSELPIQRQVIQTLEERSQIPNATASGPTSAIVKSDALNKDTCTGDSIANGSKEEFAYSLGTTAKKCCTESHSPGSPESCDADMVDEIKTPFLVEQHEAETGMFKNIQHAWNLDNPKELDAKPPALSSSDSSIEMPLHGHHIPPISSFPICEDNMELAVDRDDDENSFGCTNPSTITSKALKPQYHKIRKLFSRTDVETKPASHSRKICHARRRTQRSLFKRRKVFEHCSISPSDGGISSKGFCNPFEKEINYNTNNSYAVLHGANCTSSSATGQIALHKSEDFHAVKLSIKSFKVPELFIEIPETATVGSLKRTVMEAVTAILGGGLHVGVLLQGKKVRDDNKTLLQAGISHVDKMDNLVFMLEPSSRGASLPVTNLEYPRPLFPCDATEPLAGLPAVSPAPAPEIFNPSPEPQLNSALNFSESDHDSVYSPMDTKLLNKAPAAPPTPPTTASNSRALVPVPAMRIEALSMVPLRKPRRSELPQRRIRRPFSVSEVEALVQAVEKLGTGRWRDVKLQAFDNAKHRTYVDLKIIIRGCLCMQDKWKTLVHTARISPQQRRGEPVPQELLDRVLATHAYWSQQQAKLHFKPPLP
uniref:Telomere repeat-binding protein 3 isoform X3 n=1 Tax=Elaeis guineensis var. tenera TaxID=51953 RepID=A0A6I9RSL5_ELAGV|nr:telomere repeat-binding protein 3 isoform X3 [Elaeis guineensis]